MRLEWSGPSWYTRLRSDFSFATVKPSKAAPPTYAVDLVAAPAPTQKRLAREALPTPPPEEKPAPVETCAAQADQGAGAPEAQDAAATAPREEGAATQNRRPATPAPGETPSTGSDVATIKTPGLAFPYPEYLRNIVTQIYQRWDRASAKQRNFAEISFLILRDGSVRDIHFVTRSGSFAFDLNAQGAVEAAGNTRGLRPVA